MTINDGDKERERKKEEEIFRPWGIHELGLVWADGQQTTLYESFAYIILNAKFKVKEEKMQ